MTARSRIRGEFVGISRLTYSMPSVEFSLYASAAFDANGDMRDQDFEENS